MTEPGRLPAWNRSLRFRLTLWYMGILAVLFLLGAGLLYLGARHALLGETDAFLTREASQIARTAAGSAKEPADADDIAEAISARSAGTNPASRSASLLSYNSVYVRLVRLPSHRLLAASAELTANSAVTKTLDPLLQGNSPASGRFAFAGSNEEALLRVVTMPVALGQGRGMLQVAVPWDHNADVLENLALLLLAVFFVVLLLAAGGGWALVGRTLQPIRQIVAQAERLDASALPEALLPEAEVSDSEIGHLVATLNHMTTRLRKAFNSQAHFAAAQQRFAADASHELRTPLTILRGEMELALSRPREQASYEATLTSAVEEIDRMSRIVEGLSFLARQGSGELAAERVPVPIDLNALCAGIVAQFQARAGEAGLLLRWQGQSGHEPLRGYGQPEQIQLLLNNLVENALKYTPAGGQVTIGAEVFADHAAVVVEDTGIGIAEADLPHVFERFWRADRARSAGGSGLGLSICAQIAEANGGQLTAQSQLGVGSRFQLCLPLAR